MASGKEERGQGRRDSRAGFDRQTVIVPTRADAGTGFANSKTMCPSCQETGFVVSYS